MNVKALFKRYFIDGMGAMATGLFSSLIIGLIITQLSKLPLLSFLEPLGAVLAASSPVVGAVIGVSIAWGLKVSPLAMFSSGAVGALGYIAGGPVGSFIGVVVGAEVGGWLTGKTPADIIAVPFATIITGGLVAQLVGPSVSALMNSLGVLVNTSTALSPLPMGIAVAVIVGMVLTLPISSAALCIMLNLSGLAAGAAVAGCAAQMIGFAVISYRENGFNGLVSQGLGTSMLQVPNIMRKPIIWLAPTVASGVMGALATSPLFSMQSNAMGAGMGTSGLVGQVGTIAAMAGLEPIAVTLFKIALLHFIFPALVALGVHFLMKKYQLVKEGDMKLQV